VMAYTARGFLYDDLQQYDRAVQEYDKAIELDPGLVKPYCNRGLVYITIKRFYQGCADMRKACNLGFCNSLEAVKNQGYCL